jgi:acyl-coenzyme A thioesterase PaaI-like protein
MPKPQLIDLEVLRDHNHPQCILCGHSNGAGIGLVFEASDQGGVEASFDCHATFEGYPDVLHGGITCLLFDGAMANCMFAEGLPAVTAELTVRFRYPIVTESTVTVRAWIKESVAPLYMLAGEIIQDGRVMATAKGKFVEKSAASLSYATAAK